jgi:AcrR family transcriptional regulator
MVVSTGVSRRESRRARELAQRRADILAGAAEVFAAKGYDGAQMTEIAASAGVSLASLYAEFRGKDEIYQAVVERMAERTLGALRRCIEATPDPSRALLTAIDTLFACAQEDIALMRLVLSGTGGVPWRVRANTGISAHVMDAFLEQLTELTRPLVRRAPLRGLEAEALAMTLMGAVLQTISHALDHEPGRPLTEVAPGVRAIFARLLERKAP